jgi:glycosyltransferase involved in cell wall biosynthesis
MKIAQVCSRYFPNIGGIETHVKEISERLVKAGLEVTVLTTDYSGKLPKEEVLEGVVVNRFNSWSPNEAYYFSRQLKKYLSKKSNDYNIVHAHDYHAFPALYAAQAKGQNKLIFTPHYHGTGNTFFRNLLHGPYKFLGGKIFDVADRIVSVSEHEKNLIMKRFMISEKKIAVIPNGINVDEFKDLQKKSKSNRIILSVGRLEKYKGMQYIIKVLPKLDHDIILEIVGSGPYKKSLTKLVKELKIGDRVKFFQDLPRNELLQKYADAGLFVLLSRHEAYGISVAEALASETPCIVAETSALREWVDDRSCYGIDYEIDEEKLTHLIEKIIGKQITRPPKILSWDEVTQKLISIYREIS